MILSIAHVLAAHESDIQEALTQCMLPDSFAWDVYKEALGVCERRTVQIVGPSTDRRALEYTLQLYNDDMVRSLICAICARIRVDTGHVHSDIEHVTGGWLQDLEAKHEGIVEKVCSQQRFDRYYRQPGMPLAPSGNQSGSDVISPDFTDWQLWLRPDIFRRRSDVLGRLRYLQENRVPLLCCPEDHECDDGCAEEKRLCRKCRIPICSRCRVAMHSNQIPAMALMNENWQGYAMDFIYDVGLTWMEKTIASPYWTGMTIFCIELKRSEKSARRKDCMTQEMFAHTGRVAFKGQVFSAALDQDAILHQLLQMEKEEPLELPVSGAALAARCRLMITSGLTDLNRLLRQAAIRRDVVLQYIQKKKDSGHTDFRRVNMESVRRQVARMTRGAGPDEPIIPPDIQPSELEQALGEGRGDEFIGTDKAATPADRAFSEAELERNMSRARPQIILAQKDSDANKNIEASRNNALEQYSELRLGTSSTLLGQFKPDYPARVFHASLPWQAGGPDFYKDKNPRRRADEAAPDMPLDTFTCMNASRVEYNIRADWDLLPALWSLNFSSQVNTMLGMSIRRCLSRGAASEAHITDRSISLATARIYKMLWEGECEINGQRSRIKGDLNKLPHAIGLTETERALLTNYQFMSATLAGTRQLRRRIRHQLFSSLVIYGTPVFMTFTPSERHSGVAIHLYRGRRNDPAYRSDNHDAKQFAPYIGHDAPPLRPGARADEAESVTIELPDYDLRRLITARDPLCCVHAFMVMTRILFPLLYGFRMCPKCPHCVDSNFPCMDRSGSNGTPMGGGAGRADAMVGAVEAQQAEGVLHLHLFLYLQTAHQHATLDEIAKMFEAQLLNIDAIKAFHSHVRCAELPDPEKMAQERDEIEQAWPAYAKDQSLSQIPGCFWTKARDAPAAHPWQGDASDSAMRAWSEDGDDFRRDYDQRTQHVLSRMNHHIHPKDPSTGNRHVLKACRPKGSKENVCKGNFPLENEMTDEPHLICRCIAEDRDLPHRGSRSMLGGILSARNWSMLNAGPLLLCNMMGCNGDIKYVHKYPILPETHEKSVSETRREECLASRSNKEMLLDMQSAQAVAMGYMGGYAGKEQKLDQRDAARITEAYARKTEGELKDKRSTAAKEFQLCSKRVLKDVESKGMLRTAVETVNLCEYADHPDKLMAECIRTFPTVVFEAATLLMREEVESGKRKGASVLAPLHHAHGNRGRAYADAPFDLMYGFRGSTTGVDLFSPFEMIRFWSMQHITPPSKYALCARAKWTPEGNAFRQAEREKGILRPAYIAGLHYEAIAAKDRILLPEKGILRNLRHCWCWEKRNRPYVPLWSKCKMPDRRWSPEENKRLLCLYMRPWTLDAADETPQNPLLSNLPFSHVSLEERAKGDALPSYASSWDWYVSGHVVSELSRRYIVNLLGSTTAKMPDDDDSDDSGSEREADEAEHIGSLTLIQRTLDGLWSASNDDGVLGFGRHSTSIRLGRNLWQTPELAPAVAESMQEKVFEPASFPSGKDIDAEFQRLYKADTERPAPFGGRTEPYAGLTVHEYGRRIDDWFNRINERFVE